MSRWVAVVCVVLSALSAGVSLWGLSALRESQEVAARTQSFDSDLFPFDLEPGCRVWCVERKGALELAPERWESSAPEGYSLVLVFDLDDMRFVVWRDH